MAAEHITGCSSLLPLSLFLCAFSLIISISYFHLFLAGSALLSFSPPTQPSFRPPPLPLSVSLVPSCHHCFSPSQSVSFSAAPLFTWRRWSLLPSLSVSPLSSLFTFSLGICASPDHVFYLSFPSSLLSLASRKRAQTSSRIGSY